MPLRGLAKVVADDGVDFSAALHLRQHGVHFADEVLLEGGVGFGAITDVGVLLREFGNLL
jgi:hypothetical protein